MGCMDWNSEVERNREVLKRILALLLALAGLADRAADLPASVRLPTLAILGHGEAKARSFVIGMAFGAPAPADAAPFQAAGYAERLAASLRALALVLGAMLAQARRRAGSFARAAGPRVGSPLPPHELAGPNGRRSRAPPVPDTSSR